MEELPNVISFSGGQTSGYMLWREIQKVGVESFEKNYRVIFENTGREHDKTLEFVHRVETEWGIPVKWLEYTRRPAGEIPLEKVPEGRKQTNLRKKQEAGERDHWFKEVNFETASRIGKDGPFDELLEWANVLPNVRTRSCSVQLKVRTRDRYLRSIGVGKFNAFIGIRADEEDRAWEIMANIDQYENPKFPLLEAGITKQDVDAFWDSQKFKLEIPNFMGNCDLCFLKAKWKLVRIAKDNPEWLKWWMDWEDSFKATCTSGAVFRSGQSFKDIHMMATHPELPFETGLDDGDVACSCSIGGYRAKVEKDDE